MAHGFDIGAVMKATLGKLLQVEIPLIPYTDSKSLYDYVVKLWTTQEKHLIIDFMSLRQSYERCEVIEIKWMHGHNNPANLMTKIKPSSALKTVLDINHINLDTTNCIKRAAGIKEKKEVKRN